MTGPLEAEAGSWEPGAGSWELGAGSWEAGEIRVFNHWATGLRSGLLPEDCGVATPKMCQTNTPKFGSLQEGFDFWLQGMSSQVVCAGLYESPGGLLPGVGPLIRHVGGEL